MYIYIQGLAYYVYKVGVYKVSHGLSTKSVYKLRGGRPPPTSPARPNPWRGRPAQPLGRAQSAQQPPHPPSAATSRLLRPPPTRPGHPPAALGGAARRRRRATAVARPARRPPGHPWPSPTAQPSAPPSPPSSTGARARALAARSSGLPKQRKGRPTAATPTAAPPRRSPRGGSPWSVSSSSARERTRSWPRPLPARCRQPVRPLCATHVGRRTT